MRGVNAESRRVTPSSDTGADTGAGAVLRRVAVPAGVLAAVAGAFAYVGAVDPNEPGHYPVCPVLRLTGLYCPGCGGLRAAHAFVHGDLVTALTDNAVAVLGFAGFAVVWTVWVVHAVRGRPVRIDPGPVALWSLGAFVLLFTVVRNLPFGGWLHP
ncbi:DUF2752 domain-containing protein [Streptomyces phyllanthi]|uniref:DUF2752 domain-containing protein n=1 Tax=Streptomyces phyllanthi TaxID=1803180 RepID=A0A5N8W7A7_9ACTN|nr:DUF2752 domain-containing protein [Streptomyces phyllanthi]MPY42776.1 DUF2752 domain-containing protein [Streptomyces phyllanthi]